MTSDFLSDDRIEAALVFLASSAKEYAEAKGLRVWLEHRMKTVKAEVLLANEGTNVERAREILKAAHKELPTIESATDLTDAAKKVVAAVA